ncbi:MAG: thioredoxin-related protein [Sulfurimonas sp.]|jgi:thioredoxin-related protein|uniref:DUF255 domain-containing protein n=1 Tax=Sulfurimonas sp. TaxID=2022749 RepID=UPI0039E57BC7
MNRLVCVFLLICSHAIAVEWIGYEEALRVQEKNNKIIMIDVIRTNCGYCSNMEMAVFEDLYMEDWLEERFILVKINLDKDYMPLGIKPVMTPSFYFINNKQDIIKKFIGAWNIEDFKSLTRNIK